MHNFDGLLGERVTGDPAQISVISGYDRKKTVALQRSFIVVRMNTKWPLQC